MRPQTFDDFVGQANTCELLAVAIAAAKRRNKPLDHILLSGQAGLGKTTLARIVANQLGGNFYETNSRAISKPRDLVSILVRLRNHDVLFIDEVHALPTHVQEFLYPALEDYEVHTIVGQRAVKFALDKFTLVGATTHTGVLGKPLLDRFGIKTTLVDYTQPEIETILRDAVGDFSCSDAAISALAVASRFTPRIALSYLRRAQDFCCGHLTSDAVARALKLLGVHQQGITSDDILVLCALRGQGTMGLQQLAATTGLHEATVTNMIEPYLLRCGFIGRGPQGRFLQPKGLEYLAQYGPMAERQTQRT